MTYHVLTSKGTVVSRSTVQQVPYLELQLDEVKKTFEAFDVEISKRLKHDRGYEGDKPKPEDWSDLIDSDEDFKEEFEKVFNNLDIPQADESTP